MRRWQKCTRDFIYREIQIFFDRFVHYEKLFAASEIKIRIH